MQPAAGKVSVLAFKTMHDAGFEKRVERAVDRNGSQPRALFGEPVEHFVSADAGLGGRNLFEHLAAQVRKSQALFGEDLGSTVDGGLDAVLGAALISCSGCHFSLSKPSPIKPGLLPSSGSAAGIIEHNSGPAQAAALHRQRNYWWTRDLARSRFPPICNKVSLLRRNISGLTALVTPKMILPESCFLKQFHAQITFRLILAANQPGPLRNVRA